MFNIQAATFCRKKEVMRMKKIIKALLDIASMFLDVQDLPNNIQ